ncbi:MAG: hypothetical protein JWQ98_830 [Chlorobi bacterium]|nr:hypothetical protein [Chlorobiota bacterium]
MATQASGTFEVTLVPQKSGNEADDAIVGRLSIDKQFHGDLEGNSRGQMLAAGTEVKGSAGYVAIERFTGTLHGRDGTFMLQHNGIMKRGDGELAIAVVPDSGTGGLAGIAGTMGIEIADGKHFYRFDYTLPEQS